jgi:hypothetical protein
MLDKAVLCQHEIFSPEHPDISRKNKLRDSLLSPISVMANIISYSELCKHCASRVKKPELILSPNSFCPVIMGVLLNIIIARYNL